jgi:hypothetical protein
MLERGAEDNGGLLNSVDMRPLDLSFLGIVSHGDNLNRSTSTDSSMLPAILVERYDNRLAQTMQTTASADKSNTGIEYSQTSQATKSGELPALKIDGADQKLCTTDKAVVSDEVKATLGKFDTRVPGMVVRMPENYDPCKPINVLVYNHGFGSTAKSAIKESDFEAQMKNAPPNTVMVIPEWQANPASRSGAQGAFGEKGHFDHKMDEVFAKIPGLKGRSVNDVANVSIVAHSAGYGPTETEIYGNKISSKVKSITLLDSLYDPKGFDKWLKDNIHDLAAGNKQFTNIYHGTADNSVAEAQRVQEMLKKAGLPEDNFYWEKGNGKRVIGGDELARHSIVFKYSSATIAGKDPHSSLPGIYLAKVNEASSLGI